MRITSGPLPAFGRPESGVTTRESWWGSGVLLSTLTGSSSYLGQAEQTASAALAYFGDRVDAHQPSTFFRRLCVDHVGAAPVVHGI
jgi:hypothetical protein